jgi:ABC-type multidrug transport system fused ATPase/permease subunit
MQMMKNLKWSVRRVGALSRRYIIVSSVLAVAEGILPSITLLLTQKLLDILQNGSGTALLLTELVLLTVGLEGLQQLIETGGSTCISNEQLRCDTAIQSDILAKASRLSCRQFEDPDVQDLLSRVQYDAGNALLGSVQQLIRMAGYALI